MMSDHIVNPCYCSSCATALFYANIEWIEVPSMDDFHTDMTFHVDEPQRLDLAAVVGSDVLIMLRWGGQASQLSARNTTKLKFNTFVPHIMD